MRLSTPSGRHPARLPTHIQQRHTSGSDMGESGQRGRLFGTDGVRGVAGYELTAALALDLSVAAAAVLGAAGPTGTGVGRIPVAVVGRDPRASGEFLEAAVVAGLA